MEYVNKAKPQNQTHFSEKANFVKNLQQNFDNDIDQKEISMNMVANILGLGNAATPLGLKAMQSMQEKNNKKDTLTDSMMMFIVINTASIQIIPTTVIAIRNSFGSVNPTEIVFPVWIASIFAAIIRNSSNKSFNKNHQVKLLL